MNRFDVVGFGVFNVDKLFRVNRIAGEEESFIESQDETCGGFANSLSNMETSSNGSSQIAHIFLPTAYQELNGRTIDIRFLSMCMMYICGIGKM